MAQVNNNHILAAALALVEAKLKEALAELSGANKVTPDEVVQLVETVVDRKFSEQIPLTKLVEDIDREFKRNIVVANDNAHAYTDGVAQKLHNYDLALGARSDRLAESVKVVRNTLDAHNHDDQYSDIKHNHDGVYAFKTDQDALQRKTHEHLTNLATATLNGHQDLSDALQKHSIDVDAKFDDSGKKLEAGLTSIAEVIDGVAKKQDARHSSIVDAIGMVGDAHDSLKNNIDEYQNAHEKAHIALRNIIDNKSDVDHEHDYAPSKHDHDGYLTTEHMIALNGQLSAVDQAHSQNYDRVWQSLTEKANANEAITRNDLDALKEELTQSIQGSIQIPKDALGWDFKQHPNKQGTMMYKRDDWKSWKQIVLFNPNLLSEVNNALNRAYMPKPSLGFSGGASYQDPKELVGYTKLDDHKDVDLTTVPPAANDLLVWNAATNQWVARTVQEFASLLLPILEADLNTQYNKLIDVVGNYTYVGEALPGTNTTVAQWRIKRVEELGAGDMSITFAGGDASFIFKWDDRATLTYSI